MLNLSEEMIEDLAHERIEWLQAFGLTDNDVMSDEKGDYIRPDGKRVYLPTQLNHSNIYA